MRCARLLAGVALAMGALAGSSSASEVLGTPYAVPIPIGLIEPDIPRSAPLTHEKIALGEKLFFEVRISRSGTTSCATCHDPSHGFAEPLRTSESDDGSTQRRNAPSVINAGFLTTTMWDGRFSTLETQALDPFREDGDMGINVGAAVELIGQFREYEPMFQTAFGGPVTAERMAAALAAYQRSLVSGGTRFDHYLFVGEETLDDQEKRGLSIFLDKAACVNCHDVFHPLINPLGGGLALFTDFRFHNLGVGYEAGVMKDVGRYYVSRDASDWGAFRTPSLRNVELTAPYMHDGSLATLREVINFYDRGGNENPNLSPTLRPLLLTESEKVDLEAFLRSLTDEHYRNLGPPQSQPQPAAASATMRSIIRSTSSSVL